MNTDLLNALKEAGVRARGYARPPFGDSVFALGLTPDHPKGTIRVYQGNAKVEAHPDKSFRQCAVTVQEGNRVIKRHVKTTIITETQHIKPTVAKCEERLKGQFPILMPSSAKWTVRNLKIKEEPDKRDFSLRASWKIEADVTASVKNSTINHFLMGMDETRNFICPLPEKPQSVKHARNMLRPDETKVPGVKRQGEWFFVPVNVVEERRLAIHLIGNKAYRMMIGNTRHTAQKLIIIGHATYAKGYVTDPRAGHHRPLFLRKWHKVVKNKEAQLVVSPAQRSAAQRRQMRYD